MPRLPCIGVVLIFGLSATHVPAAEMLRAELDYEGEHYRVDFEAHLAADAARVRALLSDYDHLDRLSDTVLESRRLVSAGGTPQVQIIQRACVLIFCKTLTRVMTVETRPDGDILTLVNSEHGDFRDVTEHWQVIAHAADARVRYRAEFVPQFFVPPLLGPWFIKAYLRSEVKATADRLEALAAGT